MFRSQLSLLPTGLSRYLLSHSKSRSDFGSSGSPNILTPAGPLNRRPKEGEVGTRIEESFTRCLDVSWDVSVLYSSTEGQEWSHKLLDVLRGGVDGVGGPAYTPGRDAHAESLVDTIIGGRPSGQIIP